jgi:hypothetical protein
MRHSRVGKRFGGDAIVLGQLGTIRLASEPRRKGRDMKTEAVLNSILPLVASVCLLTTLLVRANVDSYGMTGFSITVAGAVLIACSKASLIRSGRLVTFGLVEFTGKRRRVYVMGYLVFLLGFVLTLSYMVAGR